MHGAVISDADRDAVVSAVLAAYDAAHQQRRVLVALAGRPGSGKSTAAQYIAAALRARLPRRTRGCHEQQQQKTNSNNSNDDDDATAAVCVMPMDGYHLYRRELHAMANAEEAVRRRGAEWTFAPEKLARDLGALRRRHARSCALCSHDGSDAKATATTNTAQRQQRRCSCGADDDDSNNKKDKGDDGVYVDVYVPSFDHGVGDPIEGNIRIPAAARVVIVEGNYVLYRGTPAWAAVAALFDVRVFLHCARDVCTERLCQRHMAAWHISRHDAMVRAGGSDTMNGDLVDTTRDAADVVIASRDVHTSQAKTQSKV